MTIRKQIVPLLSLLLLGVFCTQVHSQSRTPKRSLSDILPYMNVPRDPRTRLLPVVVEGKCGFIDRDGKVVVPPEFDTCHDFADERAVVTVGSKTLVIDKCLQRFQDLSTDRLDAEERDEIIQVLKRAEAGVKP